MSDAQIFQIFSLVYIAVGIGILINPGFYKKLFEDFIEHASVMYLGGITALAVGYFVLAFHNTWTKDLSVIITIFGWLALTKGIVILIRPKIFHCSAVVPGQVCSKLCGCVELPSSRALA